jgi:hypothetical protein
MITIRVDEGTAFDMLAILKIKSDDGIPVTNEYLGLYRDILKGIGVHKTVEVLHSKEYNELLKANETVFNYVEDLIHGRDFSAMEVHEANMQRYRFKRDLQEKFFLSKLTEKKTDPNILT